MQHLLERCLLAEMQRQEVKEPKQAEGLGAKMGGHVERPAFGPQ